MTSIVSRIPCVRRIGRIRRIGRPAPPRAPIGFGLLLMSLGCSLFGGPTIDPTAAGPADVVIDEIMLAPSGGEPAWVELRNRSAQDLDVRGWTLGTNIDTQAAVLRG